jgi:hypothetical protein
MRMRKWKTRTRTRRTPGTKTRTWTRTKIQIKETRRPAVVHWASKKVWGGRRKLSIIRRMESEPLKA